jgi:PleD family two-component response regulator
MTTVVLIAESDPLNLRLLKDVCEAAGHEVLTATEERGALEQLQKRTPDLVMLDVALPAEPAARPRGGLHLLRTLKADRLLAGIPVLLTTGSSDDDARKEGIELGAEDYLARPYRVFEIHQRVRNTLRRSILERLSDGGVEDGMLGSLAQLPVTLEYEMTRAARFGHPLTCVSIAAPLQKLRQTLGGANAEARLSELAAKVRTCIRGIDHLFRGGADELVAILPETSEDDAAVVIARIRERAGAEAGLIEIGSAGLRERRAEAGEALLGMARRLRRTAA